MLPSKVQEAKEQGYKIIKINMGEKSFCFKKPSKVELMRYQDDAIKNKSSIAMHSEKFVRQLFVGDNVEEFASYLDEKPLSVGTFLEECLRGLGADENFTVTEI